MEEMDTIHKWAHVSVVLDLVVLATLLVEIIEETFLAAVGPVLDLISVCV
jgi:hypothetical protein